VTSLSHSETHEHCTSVLYLRYYLVVKRRVIVADGAFEHFSTGTAIDKSDRDRPIETFTLCRRLSLPATVRRCNSCQKRLSDGELKWI